MSSTATPSELKRVLGLWGLVFYGIVLIQPIAAVGLFGIAQQLSRGYMVTTVLVCAFTGVFSALQTYLATRVWPSYNNFPNVETAFLDACGRAGDVCIVLGPIYLTVPTRGFRRRLHSWISQTNLPWRILYEPTT